MALTKINASVIANNTIAVGNIADNSVDATKIASNSILTRHIDDDQITSDQIATLTTLTVDDITIDGSTISDASHLTIDAEGVIKLDANGGEIQFLDGGTEIGVISMGSQNINIESKVADKDIKFKGIDGSSDVTALTLDMSNAGAAIFNNNITMPSGGALLFGERGNLTHDASTYNMTFNTNGATNTLVIEGTGKVGIGTASPNTKLQVNDGTNLNINVGTLGGVASVYSLNDAGSAYTAMRIDAGGTGLALNSYSGGNVGIGTASPAAQLHVSAATGDCTLLIEAVENSGSREPHLQLKGTNTSSNPIIEFGDSGGFPGTIEYENQDNSMRFGTNAAERMSIASDGKVSITAVGGMAMDVQGEGGSHGLAIGGNDGGFGYIGHRSSGAYDLKINSSGYVNMPSQPCFSAALPAVTSTGNVIVFGGEHLDVGGHYNTSNGRFTAPIAGNYHFTFWILMDPGGANQYSRVLFQVNGSSSSQWTDNLENASREAQGDFHSVGGAAIIPLGANDYVDLYNSGQNPTYGTQYGNFSGFLVS